MSLVLVAYAGRHGGTRQIAEVIAAELGGTGLTVDVRDAADVAGVEDYAAVVVGSALYYHRWRPEAVRLLERNARALAERPVWLFHSGPCGPGAAGRQVSLPPNVALLAARIDAERTATFGGRLDPATVRGLVPRLFAAGRRAGDFRDWDRIKAWARDVGRRVRTRVSL
ncbi:menaquinone-dependent protoporphyrinogen oxidase [Amycolatopsis lexingtonensis]|uniref:Menaquinone-dependent protoporphyrinogen oxidase n=1 Tax=Amycolatopsis lexingtonensis TaxID=218822 RepID=A0ABR9HRR7_9PSEU|nr:flavodoxin domain-containing protein [Amycolatopsis lexingtonensis]MBE1493610.1 menaquinone-dependent protoporphyrinogen oxidase [Amycolatopsis lexingtonensis]